MPKFLVRIIAFLLIPCLMADHVAAFAFIDAPECESYVPRPGIDFSTASRWRTPYEAEALSPRAISPRIGRFFRYILTFETLRNGVLALAVLALAIFLHGSFFSPGAELPASSAGASIIGSLQ